MQQLQFTVAGQTLTRTDSLRVVADSIGQYEAVFTIDDSWDGYVATAQYTKNGVTYDENIVDGVSEVPAEALIGSGQIHVHVVGNSPDGKRITVNDLLVPIDPSGWRQKSSISAGPVITVWHKVVAMLLLLRGGTAGQFLRKKSADSYDGEWVTLTGEDIAYDNEYTLNGYIDALMDDLATNVLPEKESIFNKVTTSLSNESTDKEYPSAKCVYDNYAPIIKSRNDLPAPSAGVAGFTFMWGGQQESGSANQIHFTPGHFYRCSGGLNDDAIEYEYAYTADATVTAETTGTYYINMGAMGYFEVTLPDDYSAEATYYIRSNEIVYEWEEVSVTDLSSLQDKTLYFTDVIVSDWDADETYADYSYRASVALTDVEATMLPDMVYDVAEATSGNYAPVCAAYSGGVYIYSKVDDEITIPSIKCEVTS
jgi:hypothetical protein